MQIVIVAGEASGDILAAELICALKTVFPQAQFSGIGGAKMIAEGFNSLFAMDRLSVMGLVEPLKRLPELLSIRKQIKQHCLEIKADLFIGVDSPDFNLNIEKFAKQHGIKTVHYVSPSVWAWRQGRIKGIKQAVDLMLCLFPFEVAFYQQHQQKAIFVGHPLADKFAMQPDTQQARKALALNEKDTVLCLMPGSRAAEVALMGELFIEVAQRLAEHRTLKILIPAANEQRLAQLTQMLAPFQSLNIQLLSGQSHTAMQAADAVLLASGTTALEAMLLKKPMVVAYKAPFLSYFIISRMVKSRFVSLPNLLADEAIVPELIQANATAETLFSEMQKALFEPNYRQQQIAQFYLQHQKIKADASRVAADAIQQLLQ